MGALGTEVLLGPRTARAVWQERRKGGAWYEEMKRKPSSQKNMLFMVKTFYFILSEVGKWAGLGQRHDFCFMRLTRAVVWKTDGRSI